MICRIAEAADEPEASTSPAKIDDLPSNKAFGDPISAIEPESRTMIRSNPAILSRRGGILIMVGVRNLVFIISCTLLHVSLSTLLVASSITKICGSCKIAAKQSNCLCPREKSLLSAPQNNQFYPTLIRYAFSVQHNAAVKASPKTAPTRSFSGYIS